MTIWKKNHILARDRDFLNMKCAWLKLQKLLVCRKQNLDNASAIRLVDIIGNVDDAYFVTEALDNLMKVDGVEYVDFYEYGMNQAEMIEAG